VHNALELEDVGTRKLEKLKVVIKKLVMDKSGQIIASHTEEQLQVMKKPLHLEDITLERVQAAYKKTGKTPGFGVSGSNICCALQAIAHAERFVGKQDEFSHWSHVLGAGRLDFVIGFDQGTRQETPGGRLGNEIAIGLGLRRKS
jgi:hypothetical protein